MNDTIKNSAALHFASNSNVDMYHVTRDGQCFEKWHDANEHSKTLGSSSADRLVLEVKRSEVEVTETKKTIEERIAECTTVEEVEALIKKNTPVAIKELAQQKIESLSK